MQTIDFLWRYKYGGLEPSDIEEWACEQLTSGSESSALLALACDPGMHWQEQTRCVEQVIDDMSLRSLLKDEIALLQGQESKFIEQYLNGELSAVNLIRIGYRLCSQSSYHESLVIWYQLEEDLSCILYSSQESTFGLLSPNDIDGSLRKILIQEGKINE